MTVAFDKPSGSAADCREIEYVSALHQTSDKIRRDGSIEDIDIVQYLASRHGINVDTEYVQEHVLRGLGAWIDSDAREEGRILDLAELAAIILIPELIKASRCDGGGSIHEAKGMDQFESKLQHEEYATRRKKAAEALKPPPGIIEDVLSLIMEEAFGSTEPRMLDEDLIRRILVAHGENVLAADDALIRDMMQAAGSGNEEGSACMVLDKNTFSRALTGDVEEKYRVEDELTLTTTYYDVFQEERKSGLKLGMKLWCPKQVKVKDEIEPKDTGAELEENCESEHDLSSKDEVEHEDVQLPPKEEKRVEAMFTFPSIDFIADTFRAKAVAVGLWTFFLTHILASGSFGLQDFPHLVPNEVEACKNTSSAGCHIVSSLLTWVDTVITTTVIGGVVIVGIGSLGNSLVPTNVILALLSFFPVVYFLIKPTLSFGTTPSDYGDKYYRAYALVMTFIIGGIILLYRLRDFSYIYLIPRKIFHKNSWLERFFVGGNIHSESHSKQAAAHKTNLMMKNAYGISCVAEEHEREGRRKPSSRAILGFLKKEWEVERTAGYRWTWRRLMNGDIFAKEGIRISSRLLAGNVLQAILVMYMIFWTKYWVNYALQQVYDEPPTMAIVRTAGDTANYFISTLTSGVNSSALKVADGAIDALYGTFLPSLVSLANESCSELFSAVNETQANEMCDALDLFAGNYVSLFDTCSSASRDSDFWRDANAFINMNMACSCISALNYSIDPISALCSQAGTADLKSLCFNLTSEIRFPSNETLRSLVRLALDKSMAHFDRFLKSFFDSGVQIMSDILIVREPAMQPWMVHMAFAFGGLVAFACATYLTLTYIPSIVSTTMQFRCGMIPSLRDDSFEDYRTGANQVTLILGGVFWGTLIYCGGLVFLIAVIILALFFLFNNPYFYLIEEATKSAAGWIVGTIIAVIIQLGLFMLFGCGYKAFYRKKPASNNIFSLLWESSWVALSVMFVVVRMLKLMLISALEVGRFNQPFLAEGVGDFGCFRIDNYPFVFRKDILSHEAHLHPYISRLGTMYLMKIRHGEKFARTPGSCWRLLFTVALMPWFRVYRQLAHPELVLHPRGSRVVVHFREELGRLVETPMFRGTSGKDRKDRVLDEEDTNFSPCVRMWPIVQGAMPEA